MLALIPPAVVLMFGLFGLPRLWNTIQEMIQGPKKHYDYFSLERAAYSYDKYRSTALAEVEDMRRSYVKLSRAHKRIGYDLGYPAKLNKLEALTTLNAQVTLGIAHLAHSEYPGLTEADGGDLGRVRETLKHFVRDWSSEGAHERAAIFEPILDVLRLVPPERRADMRVLVPGAGLGRLAWEISQLGASFIFVFANLAPALIIRDRLPRDSQRAVVFHDACVPLPTISVDDPDGGAAHNISICILVRASAEQRHALPLRILPRRRPTP